MKKAGTVAWLMYVAVRAVFAIMQMFPIDWNLRTARILARVWPVILPRHRQRALAHLCSAFADSPRSQLSRLADQCLASVTMFAVEAICLPRLINAQNWSRHVHLRDFDEALRLILSGKGVILVTGHYGSFELVGHLLACLGFNVTAVMRPLDNSYINRFIVDSRRTHGLTLLDKKGAMQSAEQLLADGAMLAFIGDQDAGRKGLFVDFFGQPASTYKSIGLLAMATGAPIVVGYARRLGDRARYEVGVERIIRQQDWESRNDPLAWITQAYTSAIESFVHEAPEQYLWIHRRWKSKQGSRRAVASGATSPPAQPAQAAVN